LTGGPLACKQRRYQTINHKNKSMKLPIASINQLSELAHVAKLSNRFLALYGKGGIGKTTVAKTVVGPALGVAPEDVWILNLSGSGPQEATGYLVPDPVTRDGWFMAPECWPTRARVGDDRPVLLVLDEYPEWDPAIQSLCRSLFDPNGGPPKIGVHELGRGVTIMVTGNRRADGSRSAVPSAPFVERTLAVLVEPTLDEWLDWAAGQGLGHSPVHTFLRFQGGDQHGIDHFNPDVPLPWDGSPHPCPRQWEAACRATLMEDVSPAIAALAIEGFVGEAAARAAVAFIRLVGDLLPQLTAIRSGAAPLPGDPASQQALVHAALRIAKRETAADPEAAIHSGALDWLVERILLPARGEIRAYGFATALRSGLPLDQHPRRAVLQGL
jgi:hypothetical protein